MARILKDEPLPHAVICDTSILWFEDKAPAVNPEFDQFWEEASKEFTLELHVPDTVQGELLFQHCTSGHKLLKQTEENIKKISSITASNHSTRINADKIRKQVLQKFDKWLKLRRGKIAQLPSSSIDWKRLANDAVWRNPPFIADPKNADVEKGFRDALILETVCRFVESDTRKINIAFLCNDTVLRETAQARLKGDQRFTSYDSLKGFETYLRLTKEKLTNNFISKIISKASDRFFTPFDPASLMNRDKLLDRVKSEYSEYFTDITKSEKPSILTGLVSHSTNIWTPVGSGGTWVVNPEFIKIEPGQRYFWKSIIHHRRLYSRPPSFKSLIGGAGMGTDERILSLPFNVTWSAMVKNDARFHDMKVEEIKLVDNAFYSASETEVTRYRLRPEPPPQTGAGVLPQT